MSGGNAIVVGIADCGVTSEPSAELVTYALGSCVAVAAHDPVARVAGLVHYMLPLSVLDSKQAQSRPYMFCDSGLKLLLDRMLAAGAQKNRLVLRAAGGAQILDDKGVFNIGRKNELILRQQLSAYKLQLTGEEFGGSFSRTVGLANATGNFWIKRWEVAGGRNASSQEAAGAARR